YQSTMKHYDYLACHFHKVDGITWLRIREVLNSLLLGRVRAGEQKFAYTDSYDDFDTIRDFVEQMDIAYLHPRRDSYHIAFLQSIYSGWKVPACFLARLKKNPLANAFPKKNLSESPSASSPSSGLGQACISFLALLFLFLFASHLSYLESLL
ncbi:MAG: hypothetical protein IIT64_05900, partial [Bacteroidaceae bacterium]|nr:hypothetical protein [Bacteroidaceae bacterium]